MSPSEGQRQLFSFFLFFFITSCTSLEWQQIQGKRCKGFSVTPCHVECTSPTLIYGPATFSYFPPKEDALRCPQTQGESPWCLPSASSSSERIKLGLKSPTRQKQDLPSSQILPYCLKTQGTFSLKNLGSVSITRGFQSGWLSSETRLILNPSSPRAVDDSVGGELGATSKVRRRGTSVVSSEFYLTTAEPVAPQELRKQLYKFR